MAEDTGEEVTQALLGNLRRELLEDIRSGQDKLRRDLRTEVNDEASKREAGDLDETSQREAGDVALETHFVMLLKKFKGLVKLRKCPMKVCSFVFMF